jgi:TonB family protein
MSFEKREQTGMAANQETRCRRCGAAVKPGKKFCSQCGCPTGAVVVGSPIRTARRPSICPECSFENHHSDLFCKGCGAQLGNSPGGLPASHSTQPGAVAPPPLEKVVKADSIEPSALNREPPNSGTDVAGFLVMPAATPSLFPNGESPAPQDSAEAQLAKRSRSGPKALGIAALGTGLVGIIVLVHFHRPARAQAKPISIASAGFVISPSSSPPGGSVARTDSAERRLRSVNLDSAAYHRQSRSGRSQPLVAVRKNSLTNTNLKNTKTDVLQPISAGSSAPVLTAASGQPELGGPSPPLPVPITLHSELAKEVPSITVGLDARQTPAEASQQIAASPPVSLPANLPSAMTPGLVPPAGPTASTANVERPAAVQPAKLLTHPSLRYPSLALEARVQGDVHLEATVRADGTVGSVKVVSGVLMLNDAAVASVQNSHYQPALVDGRPVRSFVDITVSFRLPH